MPIDFNKYKAQQQTGQPEQTPSVDFSKYGVASDVQPTVAPQQQGITGIPALQGITDFGVGVGTRIGQTGIGLGQAVLKGSIAVGKKLGADTTQQQNISNQLENIKQNVFVKPVEKNINTGLGKAGQFVGDVATYASPTSAITKGQKFVTTAGQQVLGKTGVGGFTARTVGRVLPEMVGTFGTELARTGGDVEASKKSAQIAGVASGVLNSLGDAYNALFNPDLKGSVAKALGVQGKQKAGMALNDIDNKVGGFRVLKKYAPEIEIKDADGIVKTFDPKNATFSDTLQAWDVARKKVYKSYSDLASKTTGAGVEVDIEPAMREILKAKNSARVGQFRNQIDTIIEDMKTVFGKTDADGNLVFKANPDDLQTYIQDLNTLASGAFNGSTTKPVAEISANTSKLLREALDDVIENTTGGQYQGLRSEYSALKSLENDLVRRFKQDARQIGGGLNDYAQIFNSGDIIAGIISQNPTALAGGAGRGLLQLIRKKAVDPERYLRRIFNLLDEVDSDGGLKERLFGLRNSYSKEGEMVGKDIVDYIKNPKAGASIQDVSKRIHKDDIQVMEDFIDSVRIKKELSDSKFKEVEKLAEKFGISMDKGLSGVANEFENVLTGQKKVPATILRDFKQNPTTGKMEGSIRKTSDTLLQEAKKYKSAEEFVKAQGTPVYHGTQKEIKDVIFNDATYFTNSKQYIKDFIPKENRKIYETYINPKKPFIVPNKFDYNSELAKKIQKEFNYNGQSSLGWLEELKSRPQDVKKLKQQGYDVVMTDDMEQVVVLDGSSIKTKSQLEEIWKKANKK